MVFGSLEVFCFVLLEDLFRLGLAIDGHAVGGEGKRHFIEVGDQSILLHVMNDAECDGVFCEIGRVAFVADLAAGGSCIVAGGAHDHGAVTGCRYDRVRVIGGDIDIARGTGSAGGSRSSRGAGRTRSAGCSGVARGAWSAGRTRSSRGAWSTGGTGCARMTFAGHEGFDDVGIFIVVGGSDQFTVDSESLDLVVLGSQFISDAVRVDACAVVAFVLAVFVDGGGEGFKRKSFWDGVGGGRWGA